MQLIEEHLCISGSPKQQTENKSAILSSVHSTEQILRHCFELYFTFKIANMLPLIKSRVKSGYSYSYVPL